MLGRGQSCLSIIQLFTSDRSSRHTLAIYTLLQSVDTNFKSNFTHYFKSILTRIAVSRARICVGFGY